MLFHLSTLAIILLVVYLFHRYQLVSDHLLPFLRSKGLLQPAVGYNRLSSFAEQSGAGLSSSNFDLEANNAGDSREGLDPEGAAEVQRIMREEGCSFDEARLRRHRRILARNGADATGMPTDSKAITSLSR